MQTVIDRDVREVVAALKRRRSGDELLAYRKGRSWVDVRAADINLYVKEATGGDFSAKTFRTWHATVLAAVSIAVYGEHAETAAARRRATLLAIDDVARYLGNTRAVCRASYIDPRVFDRFNGGSTILDALDAVGDPPESDELSRVEGAVIALLEA